VYESFKNLYENYNIRMFGNDSQYLSIYGSSMFAMIKPWFITLFIPLLGIFTRSIKSIKMIIFGAAISTFSVFATIIPSSFWSIFKNTYIERLIFKNFLNISPTEDKYTFYSIILFIILFSIGEIFWSPRLKHFLISVAPEGKEGTYVSMLSLKTLIIKTIVTTQAIRFSCSVESIFL